MHTTSSIPHMRDGWFALSEYPSLQGNKTKRKHNPFWKDYSTYIQMAVFHLFLQISKVFRVLWLEICFCKYSLSKHCQTLAFQIWGILYLATELGFLPIIHGLSSQVMPRCLISLTVTGWIPFHLNFQCWKKKGLVFLYDIGHSWKFWFLNSEDVRRLYGKYLCILIWYIVLTC